MGKLKLPLSIILSVLSILFGLVLVAIFLQHPPEVKSAVQQNPKIVTLNPSKDSRIFQSMPNSTGGNHTFLNVGKDASNLEWSLLAFDLSSLPADFEVDSAEVQLYQQWAGKGVNDSQLVGVRNITVEWAESAVTWNNKPAWGDTYDYHAINKANGWKTWNITNLVNDWIKGAKPNYGIYIFTEDSRYKDDWRSFPSKEYGDKNYYPKLVLKDLPECDGGPSKEIFPQNAWYTCYYQGQIDTANILGEEKAITTQALDLNWSAGVVYGSASDNISATLRRLIDFAPGYYRFTVASDDGVDLLVGGYEVYKTAADLYQSSGYNSYTSNLIYLDGKKPVRVLWHDASGSAELKISWQKIDFQEKTILGLDTDTSGNTSTSLGPTNGCLSVNTGQTADVDLIVKDVNLISSQDLIFEYDKSLLEVVNINPNMLLGTMLGSTVFSSLGISNGQGYAHITITDSNTSTNQSVETGSGVLARITLKAKTSGVTQLKVTPRDVNQDHIIDQGPVLNNAGDYKIFDINKDGIFDGPVLNGIVAIGQSCSADMDGDGFTNDQELYVGTNPLDACPNNSTEPAWPADLNNDKVVNILDANMFKGKIGTKLGDTSYLPRYDLNTDGVINIIDVMFLKPYMGKTCQ